MMKIIGVIIIFLLSFNRISDEPTSSIIFWSEDVKLQFSDFKAEPPKNSKFTAISYVGISYNYEYDSDSFDIKVITKFNKDSSWMKTNTLKLLKHEQGHFDISEAFARKFRHYVFNSRFNHLTFKTKLKEIYNGILNAEDQFHDQYDIGSRFSNDSAGQAKWTIKIDSLLNAYQLYSSDKMSNIKGGFVKSE